MGDNKSVTLIEGIELSPVGGGISSLSSSNSDATKSQKVGGRMRGGPFFSAPMQQMKLCTSDIPTPAIVVQRMNICIADFMHSHMLPFALTECPKFLKVLETAKSLGTGYSC